MLKSKLITILSILFFALSFNLSRAECNLNLNNLSINNQTNTDKADIARLQSILYINELYDGPITGYYGNLTSKAINNLKKQYNLKQDGIVDESIVDIICNDYALCPFQSNLQKEDEYPAREIKALQSFLRLIPNIYPERLVTGYFGSKTENAVKRLQKQLDISQTGRMDPTTRRDFCNFFDSFDSIGSTASSNITSIFQTLCLAFPKQVKTGENVLFISQTLGGVAPYIYRWSGDVSGSDRTTAITFTKQGNYVANLKVTDKSGNISESRCNISVGEGLLGEQGESKIVFPSEIKGKTSFPAIDLENIDQSAQDIVKKVGELLSDEQKEKYIFDPIKLAELLREQQNNIGSNDNNLFKQSDIPSVNIKQDAEKKGTVSSADTYINDNKFKVAGEEVLGNLGFQQKIENFNFIEVFEKGFKNVLCSVKQNLINERKKGWQYKKNICIGDIRTPEYSCNELTGRCVVVPYATGKYSSLSLCEGNCFKKENITRYSCNVLARQCEQSWTGLYGSYSNCMKDCSVLEFENNQVEIGGSVPDHSVVFSNQNLPDLVPFVNYFRGHVSYKSMENIKVSPPGGFGDINYSPQAKNYSGSGGIWKVLNDNNVYDKKVSKTWDAKSLWYNEYGEAIIEAGVANVGNANAGMHIFAAMVGDPLSLPGDGSKSNVKLTHHLYPVTWTTSSQRNDSGLPSPQEFADTWNGDNLENIWNTYGFKGKKIWDPRKIASYTNQNWPTYLNYSVFREKEKANPFKWHDGVDKMGEFSWPRELDSSNVFYVPKVDKGDRFRTWFRFRCQDNKNHRVYFIADYPKYTDSSPQDICNPSYTEGQTDGKIMLYNVLLNSNPTKKSQVSYSDRYFDDMYTSGLKLETGIGEYIRKNNSKTNMSISKNDILNSSKNILPSCEIDNSKACLSTTSSGNSCSDWNFGHNESNWSKYVWNRNCYHSRNNNCEQKVSIGMVYEKFDEWNNMAYIDIKCNCFADSAGRPICFSPDLVNYVPAKEPLF